ncbi:MAG TPA: nucleotide synthetase [Rhizomicrobium sp.]|nr:nucleotide synthetase [Rhizomicrobium sp.]
MTIIPKFVESAKTTAPADIAPGKAHPIGPWRGTSSPVDQEYPVYLISPVVVGDHLELKATKQNPVAGDPLYPDDPPCRLRIFRSCEVTLQLDDYNWEFSSNNPIMLGDDPATSAYSNLAVAPPDADGLRRSLSFHAEYIPVVQGSPRDPDPFNLYIYVYLTTPAGGQVSYPLSVTVDPDIKNPGDDPG